MHSGASRTGTAVELCLLYALLATTLQLSAADPGTGAAGTPVADSTTTRPPPPQDIGDLGRSAAILKSSRSNPGLSVAFLYAIGNPGSPRDASGAGPASAMPDAHSMLSVLLSAAGAVVFGALIV
eukprot:jgi/Ulvmu1/11447/UM076_0021.1